MYCSIRVWRFIASLPCPCRRLDGAERGLLWRRFEWNRGGCGRGGRQSLSETDLVSEDELHRNAGDREPHSEGRSGPVASSAVQLSPIIGASAGSGPAV